MNKSLLSKKIKQLLIKQGFTHVGITSVAYIENADKNLNQWLKKNNHGTMVWMDNRKSERGDIFKYFPQARSIIAVGFNYYTGRAKGDAKLSNYAWGDDYHFIIKKKLHNILDEI